MGRPGNRQNLRISG